MYTNGTEWLKALPVGPGTTRDKMVLDAVESGLLDCEWKRISSVIAGHEAIFSVCDDALRITLDDGSKFRPQCSAILQQKCADLMSKTKPLPVILPTAKLLDLSYQQADVKLNCTALPAGAKMSTTEYSKLYNIEFEKKRAGRTGLIRDCGKSWILSNKFAKGPSTAVNHGFYSSSGIAINPLGAKLYQNEGAAHNYKHEDYSQLILLVVDQCLLDGEMVKVTDLLDDPTLSKLVNYNGRLPYKRQPGV